MNNDHLDTEEAFDLEISVQEAVIALWRSQGCPGTASAFSARFLQSAADCIADMEAHGELRRPLRRRRQKVARLSAA